MGNFPQLELRPKTIHGFFRVPIIIRNGIPAPLRLEEVGKHLAVGPAGVALRSPPVVVVPRAARVDHVVYDGGASERLASGPVAPALAHRQAVAVLHKNAGD